MQDKLKYLLSGKFALRKLLQPSNSIIFAGILISILILVFAVKFIFKDKTFERIEIDKFGRITSQTPVPTPTPSPSPSPTPRPLTFAEMNALYGPCIRLPVLMYHHIQTKDSAIADKQTSLTVYTDIFQKQMQYLKDRGYNAIGADRLVDFFDNGFAIPPKSVVLTFDDGYQDFYTDAYPILQNLGFKATVFVPTGLVGNPDYLTWDEIMGMNGPILFANHTWSHKNVQVNNSTMQYEISTADTQLSQNGLNVPKIFAYPFGLETGNAENYLASLGYKAAFTTAPGSVLCKKQRFSLPRIRVGNSQLSSYGF